MATGKVVQVIGPVVDLEFAPEQLPEIYNAVAIKRDGSGMGGGLAGGGADPGLNGAPKVSANGSANGAANGAPSETSGSAAGLLLSTGGTHDLIVEVAQHLGDNVVR